MNGEGPDLHPGRPPVEGGGPPGQSADDAEDQRPGGPSAVEGLDEWLSTVAETAAADAGAPIDLLGEYLLILADAALSGRRPQMRELVAVRQLGRRAAEQGVDANQAVDLYLSAAWRMWQDIPKILRTPREREKVRGAAEAVLRVVNDAVQVLVEGHQAARRQMIRQEESTRREFVDDLLRGDADVSRLVERAEPFGLDLRRSHQVLLAAPAGSPPRVERAAVFMERAIVDRFGDRDVLIATKDGLLVVLIPGDPPAGPGRDVSDPAGFVHARLTQHASQERWQVTAGRPYPGAYGIARSYEEAREARVLARRLQHEADVVQARDLLLYRVLARDHEALVDLVSALLEPLSRARGGAEPLLQTMETYFATGAVATEAARRLHLSVRTVSYRLAKVKQLTGHDPADPAHRLGLHMAVVGARLLDWPATALTPALPSPG